MSKKYIVYLAIAWFVVGFLTSYLICRVYFAVANVTVDGKRCYGVTIGLNGTEYKDCSR